MRQVFYSLVSTFLIIFLNSCAYPGLILGIGGTTYGVYKEANTHYPEIVPDIPDIPNISNFLQSPFNKNTSNFNKNTSKVTADFNNEFGFECTKEVNNSDELSVSLVDEFKENRSKNYEIAVKIEDYGLSILNNVIKEINKYINT